MGLDSKLKTGIDQQSCLQPLPHTHKIHPILTAEMILWLAGLVLAVDHSLKRDAVWPPAPQDLLLLKSSVSYLLVLDQVPTANMAFCPECSKPCGHFLDSRVWFSHAQILTF